MESEPAVVHQRQVGAVIRLIHRLIVPRRLRKLQPMQKLVELLQETGQAHHQAYLATDGADPEWPLWYADYLIDKLPAHLGRDLTRSEIVYLLWSATKAQTDEQNDDPWPEFYARFLTG